MFLTELTALQALKRQYKLKLQVLGKDCYAGLILLQIAALILTPYIYGNTGSSSGPFRLSLSFYSGSVPLILTIIYIGLVTLVVTGKRFRNCEFSFVTNRLSSDLSNIAFILTFAIGATLISTLTMVMFRVLMFTLNRHPILTQSYLLTPADLGIICLSAFCYALLISALFYLGMALSERNRIMMLLVIFLTLGLLLFSAKSATLLYSVVNFFAAESSILLFSLKTLSAAVICFLLATQLNQKMEVR